MMYTLLNSESHILWDYHVTVVVLNLLICVILPAVLSQGAVVKNKIIKVITAHQLVQRVIDWFVTILKYTSLSVLLPTQ